MTNEEALAYLRQIYGNVGPINSVAGISDVDAGGIWDAAGNPYTWTNPDIAVEGGMQDMGPDVYERPLTPAGDYQVGDGTTYGRYWGQYDPQGNLVDLTFRPDERHKGYIGENIDWIGPLLVTMGAGAGALAGAAGSGGAAAGAGAAEAATGAGAGFTMPTWAQAQPMLMNAGKRALINGALNAMLGGDFKNGALTGALSAFVPAGMSALSVPADIARYATPVVSSALGTLVNGGSFEDFARSAGINLLTATPVVRNALQTVWTEAGKTVSGFAGDVNLSNVEFDADALNTPYMQGDGGDLLGEDYTFLDGSEPTPKEFGGGDVGGFIPAQADDFGVPVQADTPNNMADFGWSDIGSGGESTPNYGTSNPYISPTYGWTGEGDTVLADPGTGRPGGGSGLDGPAGDTQGTYNLNPNGDPGTGRPGGGSGLDGPAGDNPGTYNTGNGPASGAGAKPGATDNQQNQSSGFGLAGPLGLGLLALALSQMKGKSPTTEYVNYAMPTQGLPSLPTQYTTGWQPPKYRQVT